MSTPAIPARRLELLQDSELAERAVAGDGHAFAELYERHERRVYGFCLRMLGSPHDAADATQDTFVRMLRRLPSLQGRELNFAAYALACARNACYDTIGGRHRVEPVAEHSPMREPEPGYVGEDPERNALLAATREQVRAANAQLPERQREVLALREIELLSYDEIGEIVGLNRNAVAQLISRARMKLRDLLRGSALASVSASSAECEHALPLLARMQDEESAQAADFDWLRTHLTACDTCRLSQAAMQEAGVSYRALAPIVPLVWLRQAAIARAAEFVGADWSGIASGTHEPDGSADEQHGSDDGRRLKGQAAEPDAGQPMPDRSDENAEPGKRRTRWMLAGGALLALCVALFAIVDDTHDGRLSAPAAVKAPAGHTSTIVVPARRLHRKIAKTDGTGQVAAAVHATMLDSHSALGTGATAAAPAPHHSSRGLRVGRHRHKATAHPPAPTPSPKVPVITPSTTTTTATPPPLPPPPPPATTTAPPTPTTPAPAPPSPGETTGTGTTREPMPGGPGILVP